MYDLYRISAPRKQREITCIEASGLIRRWTLSEVGDDVVDDQLKVERFGHVAVLTLNAPERLNALNQGIIQALAETWTSLDADSAIRAVVVTGAGRGFCSGAHVGGLANAASLSAKEQPATYPRFTARHLKFYKPVITAVNGVCAGAGLHFVADSDIVIAGSSARFVDTHTDVGQVTALEPIGLIRRIPLEHVLRMVILGRAGSIDAAEALRISLVSEVVPDSELMHRAMQLAETAASVSPATVQASLRAIWESFECPLSEAYDRGYEIIRAHRDHPDALEGVLAFSERRKPVWV
jgi:enoyl-CoA hydratase/carnithine racemase